MPKFTFPLQSLLDHRARIERDAQVALAAVEQERRAIELELARRQREVTGLKQDLRAALAPPSGVAAMPVDIRGARLQAGATLHLRARAQQLVLQLAGVHHRLDAARAVLREASTRRRAVELLKERQFQRWKAEQQRKENNTLDELATMRAASAVALFSSDSAANPRPNHP